MINNVIHPKTKNQYWSSGCGLFCLIFRDRAQVEAIRDVISDAKNEL